MRGTLKTYYRSVRPVEEMEWALVRDWTDRPRAVSRLTEHVMRYALGLARLRALPGEDGVERSVEGLTLPFRTRLVEAFRPMILDNLGTVDHGWLESERDHLVREIEKLRGALLARGVNQFPEETLERETTRKKLVVVAGGGGGCGYVYLGAFKLLEDHGLRPSYVVGSSMGAILGLFRAREADFEYRRAVDIARRVKFRQVFEYFRTESRYGLPAALQLYLHRAIGDEFRAPDGRPMTLADLPIVFESVVTGVRRDAVKRDLREYESLIEVDARRGKVEIKSLRGGIRRLPALFGDLFSSPFALREIVVGRDALTREFDAVDAIGFSAAIPGVIHYDVLRDDPRMHEILRALQEQHRIAWLVDGGVVNNVPSRVAWEGVQEGRIGTRNAFILAFDSFSPQFRRNLIFHPVQRMVLPAVERNKQYAHFTKAFKEVLSPLDFVPGRRKIDLAAAAGYRALREDVGYLVKMMEPVDPWPKLRAEAGLA